MIKNKIKKETQLYWGKKKLRKRSQCYYYFVCSFYSSAIFNERFSYQAQFTQQTCDENNKCEYIISEKIHGSFAFIHYPCEEKVTESSMTTNQSAVWSWQTQSDSHSLSSHMIGCDMKHSAKVKGPFPVIVFF